METINAVVYIFFLFIFRQAQNVQIIYLSKMFHLKETESSAEFSGKPVNKNGLMINHLVYSLDLYRKLCSSKCNYGIPSVLLSTFASRSGACAGIREGVGPRWIQPTDSHWVFILRPAPPFLPDMEGAHLLRHPPAQCVRLCIQSFIVLQTDTVPTLSIKYRSLLVN